MSIHHDYQERLRTWSDIQDHMTYLHDAVVAHVIPAVIELGVRSGFSTSAFLSAAEYMRGQVWSCDIARPAVPESWYLNPRWHFKQGDSVSPAVLDWMPKEADVIFIDTSHTYEQTLAELRAYYPRLSAEGVVLCHDTQFTPPNHSHPVLTGPVYEAITTFTQETGARWLNRLSQPGFYGLGIVFGEKAVYRA